MAKKVGSPPKYRKSYCKIFEKECGEGYSVESIWGHHIAHEVRSFRTVENWMDQNHASYQEDFFRAIKRGKAEYMHFIETLRRSKATQKELIKGIDWKQIDMGIIYFECKTRFHKNYYPKEIENEDGSIKIIVNGNKS